GFRDHEILADDPCVLAVKYAEADIDALLCFNLSNESDVFAQMPEVEMMEKICKLVNIPVYGGGNIKSTLTVSSLFDAGCQKVILNFGKEISQSILPEVCDLYGADHIAATIASEDSLAINKELLEQCCSELILIDEHALKNNLGASRLDCIVFLPEISLEKMFAMLEKSNVSAISGAIVNENIAQITALKKLASEQGIPVAIFEPMIRFDELKKGPDGLIPCIVQDYANGQVLMMAYMNEEAYLRTLRTGKMTYYSRSRKTLWIKGETSGHFQYVKQLSIDCDNDTLLAQVTQVGAACHTGHRSCFYRDLITPQEKILPPEDLAEKNKLKLTEEVESAIEQLQKSWTRIKDSL
nr:phosphoribosyl-AMP cyclohydrolase [Lachnospiraceae bacterium]